MINIVVVGLGHIANRHIDAIESTTGLTLYGVGDVNDMALNALETDAKKVSHQLRALWSECAL